MFSLQQQREAQEDFYSRQDAIRERYECQIQEARQEALIEQEMHDYYDKVWSAGFGTDVEEYEAYWKRTFEYYESQRD